MKKLFLALSLFVSCFAAQAQTPPADTGALRTYINTNITTNGAGRISGQQLNDVFNSIMNLFSTSAGGTTSSQILTSSGSTAFTFTNVPASYNDYLIYVNGMLLTPTTHYTTSGNVVTLLMTSTGDKVQFRRVK